MIKKQTLSFLVFFLFAFILGIFWPKKGLAAPYIIINNAQSVTKTRSVNLTINPPDNVSKMMVSNDINFTDSEWEYFKNSKSWYLSYGAGTKVVYVKFLTKANVITKIYNDTIRLDLPAQMKVDFSINDKAKETNNRNVSLDLSWTDGVESIRISNSSNLDSADWVSISDNILWQLTSGSGNKTVYIEFKDANEKVKKVSKTIYYKQPANYINEGTLLKGKSSTIYYFGFDGKLHPFFNLAIYHSWYPDFSGVLQVSEAKIKQYAVGRPVCVRQGTWLIKFSGQSKMYAVEPGCRLNQIRSEVEAKILYGDDWQKRILVLSPVLGGYYKIIDKSSEDKDDLDHDSLDEDIEEEYGSSDNKVDTDNDGLSDYEEVVYWFSDPVLADTDSDGVKDGKEILAGYSPTGSGKISKLPSGSYQYPLGSVIKRSNGSYYYRAYSGSYYKMSDQSFTTNRLQKKFAISGLKYEISFSVKGNLSNNDLKVKRPQVINSAGSLIDL